MPPQSVTEISLLFICRLCSYLTANTCLHSLLRRYLYFLYVDDFRTSQQIHASTVCYGDGFTFLHVNDVRTSQETPYLFIQQAPGALLGLRRQGREAGQSVWYRDQ
jgi:hypothetical protein